MNLGNPRLSSLEFHPLTTDRWGDLEKLFGPTGACGGCWCMWWRIKRSQFCEQKGESNKKALKRIVDSGEIPGILAYTDGQPVGWCSVAPREHFPVLESSRIFKRVDEKPVWSVVCFFVSKPYRRKGVSLRLLLAATEYARENGGEIVEGYPIDPKRPNYPDAFSYIGFVSVFKKAGFLEVLRRSETRPIMRYFIKKDQK
ncbi:MAG: GNAT family N-acetyltransferase [Promethearchaeota archaeon]